MGWLWWEELVDSVGLGEEVHVQHFVSAEERFRILRSLPALKYCAVLYRGALCNKIVYLYRNLVIHFMSNITEWPKFNVLMNLILKLYGWPFYFKLKHLTWKAQNIKRCKQLFSWVFYTLNILVWFSLNDKKGLNKICTKTNCVGTGLDTWILTATFSLSFSF